MTPAIKARAERAREAFRVIDRKLVESMDRLRRTMQAMNLKSWPALSPWIRPRVAVVRDHIAEAIEAACDRCKDSSDYRVCVSEFIFRLSEDGWSQSDANRVTKPALEAIKAHRAIESEADR